MTDRLLTTADGTRLGLTVLGDTAAARTVVLFHPLPGSAGFDPDPLVTRTAGARLVTVDRPGYGASDPLPAGSLASFARHADDVARHLTAGAASGTPVGAIGWGVGGMPAAALAGRHPQLVDRLVLIDAPFRTRPGELVPPFTTADLCIADDDPAFALRPGIGSRVERMLALASQRGTAGPRFDRSALRSRAWRQTLRRIRADTVLVYGARHPLVGAAVDGARLRRRIPGSRVVRVPEATGLAIGVVWERILAHAAGGS